MTSCNIAAPVDLLTALTRRACSGENPDKPDSPMAISICHFHPILVTISRFFIWPLQKIPMISMTRACSPRLTLPDCLQFAAGRLFGQPNHRRTPIHRFYEPGARGADRGRAASEAGQDNSAGMFTDAELTAYVDRIGRKLAAVTETPGARFSFHVLDSPIVNAFALPGGYVYVSRGLVALASDEAELAGVIAHEIGHVTARHAAERYSQTLAGNVLVDRPGRGLGNCDRAARRSATSWAMRRGCICAVIPGIRNFKPTSWVSAI